jgi:hypothetical protein
MTHKWTVALIVVALVLGIVFADIQAVRAGTGPQSLKVDVSSAYPGDAPQYTVRFIMNSTIHAGDILTLIFDDGVGLADGPRVHGTLVTVDATTLNEDSTWQAGTLCLVSPLDLAAGAEHTIVIQQDARIQNPWDTFSRNRVTLAHLSSGTSLVSNYYAVSRTTQLVPQELTGTVEDGVITELAIRLRTGRNGALTGHDPIRGAGGVMVMPAVTDTVSLRLSPGIAALWKADGSTAIQLLAAYSATRQWIRILSAQERVGLDDRRPQEELTLDVMHNMPANTEYTFYIVFHRGQDARLLTGDDFAKVSTSKEPSLINLPLRGFGPVGNAGDGTGTAAVDTTAPVITWKAQASAFSSRLVTVSIDIVEASMKQAFLETGADGSLHTWLNAGHNELLLVNRSGFLGTIVATDKAGNTTRTPVDIPAPTVT